MFIAGRNESLTCSSDVSATKIEWINNGSVIASSFGSSPLTITFDLVKDTTNGDEYICKVASVIGTQEMVYRLNVNSKCHKYQYK